MFDCMMALCVKKIAECIHVYQGLKSSYIQQSNYMHIQCNIKKVLKCRMMSQHEMHVTCGLVNSSFRKQT